MLSICSFHVCSISSPHSTYSVWWLFCSPSLKRCRSAHPTAYCFWLFVFNLCFQKISWFHIEILSLFSELCCAFLLLLSLTFLFPAFCLLSSMFRLEHASALISISLINFYSLSCRLTCPVIHRIQTYSRHWKCLVRADAFLMDMRLKLSWRSYS